MGRGTRSGLPNSWNRSVDWRQQIERRGEEREKMVNKKERIVGEKELYKEVERVRLQDIKTKLWNIEGVVIRVRTAKYGTIVSYNINVDGCVTTCQRKYMRKIRNTDEETEESGNTGAENTAESQARSQQ